MSNEPDNSVKKYKSKTATILKNIEQCKLDISDKLYGATVRRINNFNWLRQQISFVEARTLFCQTAKFEFDYTCTTGLGNAYDYILNNKDEDITVNKICEINKLICNRKTSMFNSTFTRPGHIDLSLTEIKLRQAIDDWKNSPTNPIFKAFDLHYKIIILQPFDDYNKRTARMVMNWALLKSGYRPIAFTRTSDKTEYQQALRYMQYGKQQEYYLYMLSAMNSSQQKILKQLKKSR